MVSVSYSDLHSLFNLTTNNINAANTEILIDAAINLLNLYSNGSISNMSGVAGAKTVTLTSAQYGAVVMVFRGLYFSAYKDQLTTQAGGLGITPVAIMDNPTFERLLLRASRMLASYSITVR